MYAVRLRFVVKLHGTCILAILVFEKLLRVISPKSLKNLESRWMNEMVFSSFFCSDNKCHNGDDQYHEEHNIDNLYSTNLCNKCPGHVESQTC